MVEAEFTSDTITLSRQGNRALGMRWVGVQGTTSDTDVSPMIEGDEVRYERGGVVEWYRTHRRGIEQGLQVQANPILEDQDQMRITWCLGGVHDASPLEGGRALRLGTQDGHIMRVEQLAAWDANGLRLPSRFDLLPDDACGNDHTYNILVNTNDVTFPITIDPVFQTEEQSIVVDGLGDSFTRQPLSLDDQTLVVSAPNMSPGVLRVYGRHNGGVNGWGLTQTLVPMGVGTDFNIGKRIGLSGRWLFAASNHKFLQQRGKVLIFERVNGQFIQRKVLSPTTIPADEYTYGNTGAALADGVLAVGVVNRSEVFVYERDEGGVDNWGEAALLSQPGSFMGQRIHIKGDMMLILGSGKVFLYEKNASGDWVLSKTFLKEGDDDFSGGLLIEGDRIHLGFSSETQGPFRSGGVKVFERNRGGPDAWGLLGTHSPTAAVHQGHFGVQLLLDDEFLHIRADKVGLTTGMSPPDGEEGGFVLFSSSPQSPTGWSEEGRTLSVGLPLSTEGSGSGATASGRVLMWQSDSLLTDPTKALIYVYHLNELPTPNDLQAQTEEEASVEVTLTGSDPEGDTLEYRLAEDPQHGTVQLTGDKVTYVPEEDFVGTDTFTYEIFDGYGLSEEGIVTVEVTPLDDPPLAYEQSVSTDEDVAVEMRLPSLDKDSDPAVLSFAIATQPAHGTVTITANNATYTPEPDFNGEDTFTFAVSDESSTSAPAKVTITVRPVNDPPVLMGLPTTLEVPDGEAFSFEFEANDKDDDALEFSVEGLPVQASLEGNRLSWTPSYKKAGEYVFNVEVSDGELSDSGELTVVVVARDENGNGIADGLEEMQGFDPANPDDDGDGILDEDEIGDWNDPVDTDGDGTPDVLDTDSDGDGILDADEGSSDGDSDGIPAFQDKDRDGDGIDDDKDSCVDVGNPEPKDLDEDGIDDACDDDVDYVEDFDWQPGDEEPPGERGCSSTGNRQRAPLPMSLFLLVGVFGVLLRKRRLCLDTPQA